MGNYNKRDRSKTSNKFSGGSRSYKGGGDSDRPTMHNARCAECGDNCKVPFKPTRDKPVFCSHCFENKDTSNKKRSQRRDTEKFANSDKQMFQAVCDKCHKDCEVPFRPNSGKRVYCSQCFGHTERESVPSSRPSSASNHDEHKKQFEMLNNKLDVIFELLSAHATTNENESEEEFALAPIAEETSKKRVVKKKTATKKKVVSKKVVKKTALKKTVKKTVAKK